MVCVYRETIFKFQEDLDLPAESREERETTFMYLLFYYLFYAYPGTGYNVVPGNYKKKYIMCTVVLY